MKRTTLYDDDAPPTYTAMDTPTTGIPTSFGMSSEVVMPMYPTRGPLVIDIDLSGKKQSLMELVTSIRDKIMSDDDEMILYFVAGTEITQNDWEQLVNYLNSLPNKTSVVYRGIVHFEALKILTNFNALKLDKDVKLLYIASKINVAMRMLVENPELFGGFIRYWATNLRNVETSWVDSDGLRKIGFKFEIYE